ncbi:MAG: response regulator [Planctomycetota bacterium]|jgi:CheY-like chemotaxis protein
MRIEELTCRLVRHAIDVYLSVAWPGREDEKRPEVVPGSRGQEILDRFTDESKEDGGRISRRHVLRLGNSNYPHMKLVVEEYLLPDEFVFSVDTHDQLDLKPDYPDYEEWQELKERNRELKARIEERWRAARIPTYAALREMVERTSEKKLPAGLRGTILVADDERDIADAVASILIAEGYDVLLAHDGEEAVETAIRERPDLILMDFQMPRMDGVEAAVKIRKTQPRDCCRILLATASLVDLSAVGEADGFLLKPYSKEILVSFIHAMMQLPVGRGDA